MYISETCKWTPYGTDPKLDEYVDSERQILRIKAAKHGYGLDKLINDKNKGVLINLLMIKIHWFVQK